MIAPPESLVQLLKPWADFYSHSKGAATIVQFMHIGGLLLAGGLAISSDRATLRALRVPAVDRMGTLRELAAIHRWVLTGLTVIVVSGVAFLTADIETFLGSWVFWTKMTLVVMLLVNGLMMTRAEETLRRDASEESGGWGSLRRTAKWSLALWFAIVFLGLVLVNFS
jgi:hypothetical protein